MVQKTKSAATNEDALQAAMIADTRYKESMRQLHAWVLISIKSGLVYLRPHTQIGKLKASNKQSISDNARWISKRGYFRHVRYDKQREVSVFERNCLEEELASANPNKAFLQRILTDPRADCEYRIAWKLALTMRRRGWARWSISRLEAELVHVNRVAQHLRSIVAKGTFNAYGPNLDRLNRYQDIVFVRPDDRFQNDYYRRWAGPQWIEKQGKRAKARAEDKIKEVAASELEAEAEPAAEMVELVEPAIEEAATETSLSDDIIRMAADAGVDPQTGEPLRGVMGGFDAETGKAVLYMVMGVDAETGKPVLQPYPKRLKEMVK